MKPNLIRASNQRAVMTLLARETALSNADLSRRTGLAPQTISAVVADLDRQALLLRGAAVRGRRGQPATPLMLNPNGAFCIGVEIGWNHLEVTLLSMGEEVLGTVRERYLYPDASHVFAAAAAHVETMLARLPPAYWQRLIGIGLAAPAGIGDPAALLTPPPEQVELWRDVDIAARLAAATGLPVTPFNDGNAACWAEYAAFRTPRPTSFTLLLVDTFLAAGIIAESRLWEGVSGASANLGSMLVTDREGAPRFVHEVASLFALRKRLREAGIELDAVLADVPPPASVAVLDRWIADSGLAIAQTFLNTATVLEYEFAILDAALPVPLRDRLVDAARRELLQVPSLGRVRPTLRSGQLRGVGAARGAAKLCLYRRYFPRELEHMGI